MISGVSNSVVGIRCYFEDKKAMINSRMKDICCVEKGPNDFDNPGFFLTSPKNSTINTQVEHSKFKHKTQGLSKNPVKIIAERKGT